MRNFLALIGFLVVGFVGLGWYMGWYKLSFSQHPDGQLQITTNVNTQKVTEDSAAFFHKAAAVVGGHLEKAARQTPIPPEAPGNTPGPQNRPHSSDFNPLSATTPSTIEPAPHATVPPPPPREPIRLIAPK
ncbi:MAG: hypothetical protein RMJ56_17245 [Gemmataceae bacterium]|nr:hypothetical protein [Gemmata sp.]MDW8199342.1 hypothetical protein [Gemmataceae bacterium]